MLMTCFEVPLLNVRLSQDSYSKCQIIMTWHISALKPRPVEAMEMILAYCIERHAKGNQLDVSDKLVC